MADLDSFASPRAKFRRRRRSKTARVRHSKQLEEFCVVQATRLSSTPATILSKLSKYSADKIRAAANLAAIP